MPNWPISSSGNEPALLPRSSSRYSLVPDRAMVPMKSTSSALVMPMPLSETVSVRAPGSTSIRMWRSSARGARFSSVRASKRSLSSASEALDTSSLRKISRLE